MADDVKTVFSENVAEIAANAFLTENVGLDLFMGADIESVLSARAQVIYQDVEDSDYSGAAISFRQQNFVVLNTWQPLRARYYSAAHELWHLALQAELFGPENKKIMAQVQLPLFDMERAADHFAAAVMMPKEAMLATWSKYVGLQPSPDKQVAQAGIVRIANISSMPYVAVARRLKELGLLLSKSLVKLSESDWRDYVRHSNFPPSSLDQAVHFKKFAGMAELINQLVTKQQITLTKAASLAAHTEPQLAVDLLNRRQEQVDRLSEDNV